MKPRQSLRASFRCAFAGLRDFLRERNARLQLLAAVLAIGLGLWLGLPRSEWVAIVLCCVLVLAAEAFNSALEKLADALHPAEHPLVGRAKDLAAGAVLLLALASLVVGGIVFFPRLWVLFHDQ